MAEEPPDIDSGSRRARYVGLIRLAGARLRWRVIEGKGTQTTLSVLAVAAAIALLLLVTGMALGLVGATTQGTTADYWIVPEGGATSAVVGVESQRLGQVHPAAERIQRLEGVTDATPVLLSLRQANRSADPTAEREYVLVVGVVPSDPGGDGIERVAGLSTTDLTPGDPYYADGGYDGRWTGEAVLSAGAAETLGVERGAALSLGGDADQAFRVREIRTASGASIGQLPLVVVHLSELQRLVGATETDSADQLLVTASDPVVEERLATVYPGTDVLTQSELVSQEASTSQLPVAVALITLGVSVVLGTLFVVTSLGFEVAESAPQRAMMAALGVSRTSRSLLVATEALLVSLCGGVLGVGLWLVGLPVVNALGRRLGSGALAVFDPVLAGYGVLIALCIGLLTVPYLLVLGDRTTGTPRLGE